MDHVHKIERGRYKAELIMDTKVDELKITVGCEVGLSLLDHYYILVVEFIMPNIHNKCIPNGENMYSAVQVT